METGEDMSRAIGWSEVRSRPGGETREPSLYAFELGPTAPDAARRATDAAFSGVGHVPAAAATLIYLDARTFTRDCIGRWLQTHLSGFRVCALQDLEQIVTAPATGGETRGVILNTGPERMSSAAVTNLMSRLAELLPSVPVAVLSDYEDPDNIRAAFDMGVRGCIPTTLARWSRSRRCT